MTEAMKCSACGSAVSSHAKFCGSCGAPLQQATLSEASLPPPETNAPEVVLPSSQTPTVKTNKWLKPVVALVLVVVALVATVVSMSKPSNYDKAKGSVRILYLGDETVVVPHGKAAVTLQGTRMNGMYSLDETKAAMLIDEDENENNYDSYALYLVTDKPERIADDVADMVLSLSGNAIAFLRDVDVSNGTGELCLYANGTITRIAPDCSVDSAIALSPDGKTVAYATYDNGDYYGFYWDGKNQEIGKGAIPIAIADGAKYMYYVKNETVYVQKGSKSETKVKLSDNINAMFFNKDFSQAVFATNSNAYLIRNADKKEALPGVADSFLLPYGAAQQYMYLSQWQTNSTAIHLEVYGVSSFANMFYINDSSKVIRINKDFSTETVATGVAYEDGSWYAALADDGKTLTLLKGEGLYQLDGMNDKANPVRLVDDGVMAFSTTAKGDGVYFVNADNDLYYQKGTGKPVLVSNDFDYYSSWSYSNIFGGVYKGNQQFFISNGELCVSIDGKATFVKGLEGEAGYVGANMFGVYVDTWDEDGTRFYDSTDGANFTLMGIQ